MERHIANKPIPSLWVLSDGGIETTGRIKAKKTVWDDIIQVGATEE